jgi:hypothetical protein
MWQLLLSLEKKQNLTDTDDYWTWELFGVSLRLGTVSESLHSYELGPEGVNLPFN